jgi:hypothetical protein
VTRKQEYFARNSVENFYRFFQDRNNGELRFAAVLVAALSLMYHQFCISSFQQEFIMFAFKSVHETESELPLAKRRKTIAKSVSRS